MLNRKHKPLMFLHHYSNIIAGKFGNTPSSTVINILVYRKKLKQYYFYYSK